MNSGEHILLLRQPAGTGEIKGIDWSPDGARMAISYGPSSNNMVKALYVANADGSDLRLVDRIAAGQWGVWQPGLSVGTAWSPDGTRLAYSAQSPAPNDSVEIQVWAASVDGSGPSLVASDVGLDGGGPVWSPDGSRIAFVIEGSYSHYLVFNADGTGEGEEIHELTYRSWDGGWFFCGCYG